MRTKKIVMINGGFDLLHVGHLHLLKEAKKLGDILIIGINSDKSKEKQKGWKPIIPAEERKQILEAIKYVDKVYIYNELTPVKLIRKIKPDIIAVGDEPHKRRDMIKEETTNIARFIPILKNKNKQKQSTGRIIERIRRK